MQGDEHVHPFRRKIRVEIDPMTMDDIDAKLGDRILDRFPVCVMRSRPNVGIVGARDARHRDQLAAGA